MSAGIESVEPWRRFTEREAEYQRHARRRAVKKQLRLARDRNNWLWWSWVQVLLPQTDGLPFELEPERLRT